jgi:putative ABC transport system substrate-binding protein
MDRRQFLLAGGAGLIAAPLIARAQQAGKIYRLGILGNVPLSDSQGARVWGALTEGLWEFGYVEGENLIVEHRSTEGRSERLSGLVAEMVRLKPDVIVVPNQANALAVREATRTIPIVAAYLRSTWERPRRQSVDVPQIAD